MRGRIIKAHVPSWLAEHPCYKGGMLDLSIRGHMSMTEAEWAVRNRIASMDELDDITADEREMRDLLARWLREQFVSEDAFSEHGQETLAGCK